MGQYSTNYNATPYNSRRNPSEGSSRTFGRVLDIILDETHPEYRNKGGAKAINGVFFRYQANAITVAPADNRTFAYHGNCQFKTIPVVGEIVEITSEPTSSKSALTQTKTKYYTKIVNIWNNPNSNPYLDVYSNGTLDISSGGNFIEEATVNPIKAAVGDVLIEGRQGQSIRITGAKGVANPFIDDSNNGEPVILISNGQIETEEGFTTVKEDVNIDDSSLYFVANHSIPLTQANYKRKSYNNPPTTANEYKGNQVLLNSGRIFFNAKEKDILLSSIESVGINTEGSVNIDAETYICIDSPEIYLGEKARTAQESTKEPLLLGNQTERLLDILLDTLVSMARDMAKAKTIDGKPIPLINKRGIQMQPVLKTLQRQINPTGPSKLKSKKVFTE